MCAFRSRQLADLDFSAIHENRQAETKAAGGDRQDENTTDRVHNRCEDLLLLGVIEGLQ